MKRKLANRNYIFYVFGIYIFIIIALQLFVSQTQLSMFIYQRRLNL